MLRAPCSALLAFLAAGRLVAQVPAASAGDTLLLTNGDQLAGRLLSVDPEHGVRWHHPDALDTIEFSLVQVAELELARREQPTDLPPVNARVHLVGEGELEGSALSWETNFLSLDTWFAGRLRIPRQQVRVVQPVRPQKAPLFEGPSGFEGWTIGKVQAQLMEAGQWRYRQGAFYARNSAAIARDVGLPDRSILEFDLAWQGVFHLAVALYADSLEPISLANKDNEPDFGGFYSLQLNSFSADLLPVKRNEPLRYMGQVPIPAFGAKNGAHVEVRCDKRRKLVCLMVDGGVVRQWLDTNGFAGQGRAIRFVNQGRGGLKISRIRVSEWDGRFEERPTFSPGSRHDVAWLRNGERVEGTLVTIQEGVVKLRKAAGEETVELAMDELRQLALASSGNQAAGPSAGVQIQFWESGALSLSLERWDNQGVLADLPGIGRVTLNPAAIRRIEFSGR